MRPNSSGHNLASYSQPRCLTFSWRSFPLSLLFLVCAGLGAAPTAPFSAGVFPLALCHALLCRCFTLPLHQTAVTKLFLHGWAIVSGSVLVQDVGLLLFSRE